MSNVRNYTDAELIHQAKSIKGFKSIPKGLWLIFIRSNEDEPNRFDDKVYIMQNEKSISVSSCTTNSGTYGLFELQKWNQKGTAIIKFDEWYYDTYKYGLHKGKMPALRQVKPMKYFRDGNKNLKSEENGQIHTEIAYTNIHFNSYTNRTKLLTWLIGEWSVGCMVLNDGDFYYNTLIRLFKNEPFVSVCCIREK